MIGNILDNTTELYMIQYTFGEIFSSGGATLCKNPSDQTVDLVIMDTAIIPDMVVPDIIPEIVPEIMDDIVPVLVYSSNVYLLEEIL